MQRFNILTFLCIFLLIPLLACHSDEVTPTPGGFVITMTSPQRDIRVQNGHVLVEQGGTRQTYADTDKRLEKWLLTVSKPHIEPQLYSLLEEEIGK